MSKNFSFAFPNWMQPCVLGVVVLIMYAITLTNWHLGDDLQWAMQVESYVTGKPTFHPTLADAIVNPLDVSSVRIRPQVRYFLELPTLAHIYNTSRLFKWADNAIRPMQATHAVFGAIGVIFFFLALVQFMPRNWAFMISLGLAFSYSWWFYSTHLDYTIASHALSCIWLYLLCSLLYSQSEAAFKWLVLALGAVNALTSLYLLTGILLFLVMLITFLVNYKINKALYAIGLYLSSMLLTIVFVVGIAWTVNPEFPLSISSLLRNLTYAEAFSHGFALSDVPKSLYGFVKTLVTYPALGRQTPSNYLAVSSQLSRGLYLVWYLVVIVIAASPFILLAKLYKQLGRHKSLAISLGLWFIIQLPFAIYWEPSYIKWWTGALIPWWGLIGLLWVIPSTQSNFLQKARPIALASLVLLLFSINFFFDFLPNSRPDSNPWIQAANMLENSTGPDDLFVSLRYHPLDFYLPYFAKRHTLSFEMILVSKGRDTANQNISEAIRATLERGGRVFIYLSDDQISIDLQDYSISPDVRYERIVFENVSTPDFTVYEITRDKP